VAEVMESLRPEGEETGQRLALMVMGMHRSGTSALSGIAARLGCSLPTTEMPATASNEKGFYESRRIYELNNALMQSAGIDWRDWMPFPANWEHSKQAEQFQDQAREVLRGEFGSSPFFVMKDPRICRVYPFWKKVLEAEGCAPALLYTHRNPLEVAASLENLKKTSAETGLIIWLRYVLDAEIATRGERRCFTSFQRIIEDWPREIAKAEQELGFVFRGYSQASQQEVDSFLSRDLRHFEKQNDLAGNQSVPAWICDTYAVQERWAAEGEDTADYEILDRVKGDFDRTGPTFAPFISNETRDLKAEVSDQGQQAVAAAETREKEAVMRAEKLKRELTQVTETRNDLSKQLEQENGTIQEMERAMEAANTKLQTLAVLDREKVLDTSRGLEQSESEKRRLLGDLGATQSALKQRKWELEETRTEVAAVKAQIAILEAECKRLKEEPSAEQIARIATLEEKLHQREARCGQVEKELVQRGAEKAALLGQLQTRYQELSQLATLLCSQQAEGEKQTENLRASLQSAQDEQSAMVQKIRDLEEKVLSERAYHEHVVHVMRTSRSWKVTAPLRRVIDKLRG